MFTKNEISNKVILTACAFALSIFSAVVCIGFMIESNIEAALTVHTKQLMPLSSDYK